MTITEIDLSKQIGIAQIAFALMMIAFAVVWKVFVRFPDKERKQSQSRRQK